MTRIHILGFIESNEKSAVALPDSYLDDDEDSGDDMDEVNILFTPTISI